MQKIKRLFDIYHFREAVVRQPIMHRMALFLSALPLLLLSPIALKALPPGIYKVIWHVLSVDTHRTQGEFSFRVGQ